MTLLRDHCRSIACIAAVLLVSALYWPVHDGDFAGIVDRAYFHDFAWLRTGASWHDILFHNTYNWSNYYRPLVVALLVVEERLFGVEPGPMHLVSLGFHLVNMLLVGLLAARLLATNCTPRQRCVMIALSMVVYGIHPALVEPVVLLSCRFDLVAAFFILLGLVAHTSNMPRLWRAVGVGTCFFLGACSKESAIVLPALVLIIDWTQPIASRREPIGASIRRVVREQWPSYLLMFCGGLVYLGIRHYSLGYLIQGASYSPIALLTRIQMVCWLYLTYWGVVLWPMAGASPIHEGDAAQFARLTPTSIAADLAAAAILVAAIGLMLRSGRTRAAGLIAAVTVALMPVLRIAPVNFDSSLYHERYAMPAIAAACAFLPAFLAQALRILGSMRVAFAACAVAGAGWLIIAAANVAVTVPLWLDDLKLWQWVAARDPYSLLAKNFLLNAYLAKDDLASARIVADDMSVNGGKCPLCLLNVASLRVKVGDAEGAQAALDRTARFLPRLNQPRMTASYELTYGKVHEMRGELKEAEASYRRSLELEPLAPGTRMRLAILLASEGRANEAVPEAAQAAELMAPDDRDAQLEEFRRALEKASRATKP